MARNIGVCEDERYVDMEEGVDTEGDLEDFGSSSGVRSPPRSGSSAAGGVLASVSMDGSVLGASNGVREGVSAGSAMRPEE